MKEFTADNVDVSIRIRFKKNYYALDRESLDVYLSRNGLRLLMTELGQIQEMIPHE